jgi:hypothetical protein
MASLDFTSTHSSDKWYLHHHHARFVQLSSIAFWRWLWNKVHFSGKQGGFFFHVLSMSWSNLEEVMPHILLRIISRPPSAVAARSKTRCSWSIVVDAIWDHACTFSGPGFRGIQGWQLCSSSRRGGRELCFSLLMQYDGTNLHVFISLFANTSYFFCIGYHNILSVLLCSDIWTYFWKLSPC